MDDDERHYLAQRFALSRALALAGIVTTLTIPLAFYARSALPDRTQVPLIAADGRAYYLASVILVAVIAALIQALETDDPARLVNRYGERLYQYRQPAPRTAWMLPGVALLAAYLFLALHHPAILVVLVPFACGGLVLAARMVRHEVMNRPLRPSALIQGAQLVLVIAVAAGAFLTVFAYRARTLYAGPLLFLMSILLLMSLFDGTESPPYRRFVHAAIGGIAVAQVYWALGYWNVSTLIGGLMLTLVFAFYGNLSRTELDGGITRPCVAATAGGAVVAFLVLAYQVE